jgi:hypothetical protein
MIGHKTCSKTFIGVVLHSEFSEGIFLFAMSRPTLWLSQPPVLWLLGAVSREIKRTWREADYLPPYSAKDNNEWSCLSTLPCAFISYCLIKYRDMYLWFDA